MLTCRCSLRGGEFTLSHLRLPDGWLWGAGARSGRAASAPAAAYERRHTRGLLASLSATPRLLRWRILTLLRSHVMAAHDATVQHERARCERASSLPQAGTCTTLARCCHIALAHSAGSAASLTWRCAVFASCALDHALRRSARSWRAQRWSRGCVSVAGLVFGPTAPLDHPD